MDCRGWGFAILMLVRQNLHILAVALLAMVTASAEVRYLSSDGDDGADGRSPERAWRTLGRLNASLPPGGEARLRRGDVFFGGLDVKGGIDAGHPTVVTVYGTGPRPEISRYKIAKPVESAWENVTGAVWRIDLRDPSRFSGDVESADANVGFLRVNGTIHGTKRRSAAELSTWLEFCHDGGHAYVWSGFCPAALSPDFRFACNGRGLALKSNTVVSNLVVRGCGGHGAQFAGENIRIENCAFREIGGSYLIWGGDPHTRYGNGVECWAGSRHVLVTKCDFTDIYDVAFTMQGNAPPFSWEDIHATDSTISRCTQGFEVWSAGCRPGVGFVGCSFERNTVIGCGWSWGCGVRPGVPLLVNVMDTDTCDILVKGNVFRGTRAETLHKSGGLCELPRGYDVRDNLIELKDGATIGNVGEFGRRAAGLAREAEIRSRNRIVKEGGSNE